MSPTLSSIARSSMTQMYLGLDRVLAKGGAAARARGVEPSVYLESRLAPDMLPLKTQIRFALESVRQLAQLAGEPLPALSYDESSFEDLRAAVSEARRTLRALPAEAMDRAPDETIKIPAGEHEIELTRAQFFQNFVLPNFYFHVTTAYAILRHLGVEIGKADFLAAPTPG